VLVVVVVPDGPEAWTRLDLLPGMRNAWVTQAADALMATDSKDAVSFWFQNYAMHLCCTPGFTKMMGGAKIHEFSEMGVEPKIGVYTPPKWMVKIMV